MNKDTASYFRELSDSVNNKFQENIDESINKIMVSIEIQSNKGLYNLRLYKIVTRDIDAVKKRLESKGFKVEVDQCGAFKDSNEHWINISWCKDK